MASARAADELHWSYVPPVAVLPAGAEGKNPVDAFLEDARAKMGLKAAPETPPRQWLERAAYTLTGLPPSEAQMARIEKQPDEATRKALVDELLASPAYGERWARHWMDVARYADTSGYNFDADNRYPFAYTYRDWLIRAFNQDLPYARFVQLQIAADLMVDRPDHPDLAALGFITVGPRSGHEETIDDRVDVVTRGFMASTVSCARCHDHKFDPITTQDYYSLYSIFDNTTEPEQKPVVGMPGDDAALKAYQAELEKLEKEDLAVRQGLVDHLRNKESLAVYLDLGWRAKTQGWEHGMAASEAFKRGRYRAKAVLQWRDWLKKRTAGDKVPQPIADWDREMAAADDAGKKAACAKLAEAWMAGGEFVAYSKEPSCPMSYEVDRVATIMDTEDENARRKRASAMSKLQAEHPGSPPRAMTLQDKPKWSEAVVFKRGNPAMRGEKFDRHWFSFLGGEVFPKDRSARLSLAEKIADPKNPLTARVMVNRVWAWNFGAPLADPSDFGTQQPAPPLQPLLDYLAVWFTEHGGSVKELNRLLVTSQAFRLAADGPEANDHIDEANTRFWKWNRRRLDFEAMRDHLLVSAGSLETSTVGGRSVKIEDASADRRRSVYSFIDRYALPGVFVSFDLPHPDHLSAGRGQTTVPQQALYFLNSPLLLRGAEALAKDAGFKNQPDDSARVAWLYRRLYQRDPRPAETQVVLHWLAGINPEDYQPKLGGSWEVRHADDSTTLPLDVREFPLFADGVWKTGPDPATAPIRWLNVGAGGGHVAARHAMILRWRANGPGEVKMNAYLKRTQKEGNVLAWRIDAQGTHTLSEGKFAPESTMDVAGGWVKVQAGDTVDLVLRAPDGDACGGIAWTIKVLGRDSPSAKPVTVGNFTSDFPKPGAPSHVSPRMDPWADVIQMLWASNEFNFID
ncbi:MAG: DUF1549 and DUF1553 domain-containing protein [Luteolibacter sp.]